MRSVPVFFDGKQRVLGVIIAICLLGSLSLEAWAGPLTINWTFNAADCDGLPVNPADYQAIEIYIAQTPIPAAEAGCVQDGAPPDSLPSATPIQGVPGTGTVTATLAPGRYYIRARVQLDGDWSQLSGQLVADVTREAMVLQISL